MPPNYSFACGHVGPYSVKSYKGILTVLKCNRPARHDPGEHSYSPPGGGPTHVWDDQGRPIRPTGR
jgi:hypothetical protein